ncbi:hypothetical protein PUG81_07265 [Erwiniaceae bacterium L1_54_6]|jgi:hypothetical protein|nr:hypothetical protein [Erwiniaceae bacterium L1_54_6]
MHITPSSTLVAAPAQPHPSATSRLLESLRSIGNSLAAIVRFPFSESPSLVTEQSIEEIVYPAFRTNAEIHVVAKKWGMQDFDTVKMIVNKLADIEREKKLMITELDAERIYLHRAQPKRYTNLKSNRIGNKINACFPGDGIYFLASLKKKEHNPYAKHDSFELVCRMSDVLRCGGTIIDDPYSFLQGAVFVKLPQNEFIPFVPAKDL